MGNALRHVRGESQKNIVRFIEGLSGKYSRWDIWQDFIIMSASQSPTRWEAAGQCQGRNVPQPRREVFR